ncbi:hypothetical protein CSOJ01_11788 [Colletotrichum sojae]|uniref:Uncharacterized protein n=1 Tax=Colletotrichum sojae TaxID=2175907 RepID=A0A8H6MND1_9PEZI|nr:hypothetical protein CSOJ01_11788 [Colletotrichum sojae]
MTASQRRPSNSDVSPTGGGKTALASTKNRQCGIKRQEHADEQMVGAEGEIADEAAERRTASSLTAILHDGGVLALGSRDPTLSSGEQNPMGLQDGNHGAGRGSCIQAVPASRGRRLRIASAVAQDTEPPVSGVISYAGTLAMSSRVEPDFLVWIGLGEEETWRSVQLQDAGVIRRAKKEKGHLSIGDGD